MTKTLLLSNLTSLCQPEEKKQTKKCMKAESRWCEPYVHLCNQQPKHDHQSDKQEESRQKLFIHVLWCPRGRCLRDWQKQKKQTLIDVLLIKDTRLITLKCVKQIPGGGLPSLMLKAVAKIPKGKAPIPNDIWKPPSPNPKPWKPCEYVSRHHNIWGTI